jgi:hypothetical protein
MKTRAMKAIEWGRKQNVITQFNNIKDFQDSKYLDRYADKFGYNHLIEEKIERMSKMNFHNIYIVEANPKANYGLDFKMFVHYTIDEGIQFMKEITLGGSSITSRPLQRIRMNFKRDEFSVEFMDFMFNNIDNEEKMLEYKEKNTERYLKANSKDIEYRKNGIIESFEFSMNVGYKKDREFRAGLAEASQVHKWIFA